MADHRDLTLAMLADAEIDALGSAATWRDIARAALAKLHEQHVEIERLREQHHRLIDEYRHLRADTICQPPRRAA